MYKHLLIATDGSELAAKAVEQGLALAKALHAKATAITATESWTTIATNYRFVWRVAAIQTALD